jgi:hypothetical protein
MTLSIDIQHKSIECHYAECHYAECRDYLNVMLNVIMLSVVRLNVIILSAVAPCSVRSGGAPRLNHNRIVLKNSSKDKFTKTVRLFYFMLSCRFHSGKRRLIKTEFN